MRIIIKELKSIEANSFDVCSARLRGSTIFRTICYIKHFINKRKAIRNDRFYFFKSVYVSCPYCISHFFHLRLCLFLSFIHSLITLTIGVGTSGVDNYTHRLFNEGSSLRKILENVSYL